MIRSEKRDWLWIILVGLLVQGVLSLRLTQPTYMDGYYYATNGQRLADGYGFTERVIWQFLDEPAGLPAPSHTYWMPLPSLLAAAGYKLAGGFRGAQIPFWFLAGLLPWLSFVISQRLDGQRWQAWTAALLTASSGLYINFLGQPSTFAPFALAGGGCLLALAHANQRGNGLRLGQKRTVIPAKAGIHSPISMRAGSEKMDTCLRRYDNGPNEDYTHQRDSSPLWWLLAGLMAGLGHLTRADGALLLAIGVFVWVIELRHRPIENRKSKIENAIWLLMGYFLIMGGWFVHNWIVWGRPLSTVGTQTIFLTTYDDLFAYGRSFDLSHLLAWGWGNILRSKLEGVWLAGQTFVAVSFFIFLTPFVLWGWLKLGRRSPKWSWLRPMTWYTAALFLTMSLIFTFPGERGGLFHSSAALWPWFMALAAAGVSFAVDWAAARLPHWQPERAKRMFSALFVGVAFVTAVAIGTARLPDDSEALVYTVMGEQLPETAVVMAGNAPGFYYHTGLAAVSVPNEPVDILLQAAKRYGVTHLVLDENRPQPLKALYSGSLNSPYIQLIDEWNGRKLYALLDVAE